MAHLKKAEGKNRHTSTESSCSDTDSGICTLHKINLQNCLLMRACNEMVNRWWLASEYYLDRCGFTANASSFIRTVRSTYKSKKSCTFSEQTNQGRVLTVQSWEACAVSKKKQKVGQGPENSHPIRYCTFKTRRSVIDKQEQIRGHISFLVEQQNFTSKVKNCVSHTRYL